MPTTADLDDPLGYAAGEGSAGPTSAGKAGLDADCDAALAQLLDEGAGPDRRTEAGDQSSEGGPTAGRGHGTSLPESDAGTDETDGSAGGDTGTSQDDDSGPSA